MANISNKASAIEAVLPILEKYFTETKMLRILTGSFGISNKRIIKAILDRTMLPTKPVDNR